MERIVLGFDGSPEAVSALEWTAARVARRAARVDVVIVVSTVANDQVVSFEELREAEQFLLDRLPGIEIELHRLEESLTRSIAEAADGADLIVIGVNPGHTIRAAAAGWGLLRLSTRANASVCMVPLGWVDGDDPVTVGVADDGSSRAALEFAIAEAAFNETGLRLVHSWLMPSPMFDYGTAIAADPQAVIEDHRRILSAATRRVLCERPDLPVESQMIRDSRAAALLRFAARSSLLVIGTHHRGVVAGSLFGSVAREVLWRADCPVCVVPPQRAVTIDPELMDTAPSARNRAR